MRAPAGVKRSGFLGLGLLALCESPARAQQTGKTYRVDILSGRTLAYDRLLLAAFRRTLSGLGYVDGKNATVLYRSCGGDYAQLPALAAGLVRAKPDAIVAVTPQAVIAAKHATASVPIVMCDVSDPVADGLVASLSRPGNNVTGTANMAGQLSAKRLELLKEMVPRLRRLAVILNRASVANLNSMRGLEAEVGPSGIQLLAVDVRSPNQIDAAFKTIAHQDADALLVLPDGMLVSNAARIVLLATTLRLPAVIASGDTASRAGGLMSYGASETGVWGQAATYVARILKGAKPADLPVAQPTSFNLIVNLKTARALGITVPQSILLQATQVIR